MVCCGVSGGCRRSLGLLWLFPWRALHELDTAPAVVVLLLLLGR